jgi:CRISPR type III-A-associated RAMP protein Csm4
MLPASIVRLRPLGPWRSGPDSGSRSRVDPVFHSDSLYSAVTAAMASLGRLEEWLDATARATSAAVRFGSCYPYANERLFAPPPRNVWPPAPSTKVRWKGARFVPLDVIDSLLCGDPVDEEAWVVDGMSECLMPSGSVGPFRIGMRTAAGVDRLGVGVSPHATACVEFSPDAGLWALVSFSSEETREQWFGPVRNALRLLADSGVGGERSRGWGSFAEPQFTDGDLSALLTPRASGLSSEAMEPKSYWLLSLFAPASSDQVQWDRGSYGLVTRSGRVESPAGSGQLKKELNMIAEGSVIVAANSVDGAATDVAPDGFPHPVYRAGFAVAVPLPNLVPTLAAV